MSLRMTAAELEKHLGQRRGKKTKTASPSEAAISNAIAGYLSARRIYNDRLNSGSVVVKKTVRDKAGAVKTFESRVNLCKTGTPDRFLIYRGRIVFVEVKAKGKRPRPEQLERHAELRAAGALVINADSIDGFIAEFLELKKKIDANLTIQ